MMVKPSTFPHALAGPEEHPYKRPRIMNTPPDDELLPPPRRLAKAESDLIPENEAAITASWGRLLQQLREEVKVVTDAGSDIIPTIDFEDLSDPRRAVPFLRNLNTRGTAVIRNVIPSDDAESWNRTLEQYLADNSPTETSPPEERDDSSAELHELFWSLAQLSARAHPNTLAAQRLLMSQCWHGRHGSSDPEARMSTRHPVTYADRVCITGGDTGPPLATSGPDSSSSSSPLRARVRTDGGEIAAYRAIWAGRWEEHDPWDGAARLGAGAGAGAGGGGSEGSVFRMFEGALPLSVGPGTPAVMRTCPLPLRLSTAYRLLRPFFAPKRSPLPQQGPKAAEGFLSPSNWALLDSTRRADRGLPGGLRGGGELDVSAASHPHLRLDETLVPLPRLAPGDYVVWHPDAIFPSPACAADGRRPGPPTTMTLLCLPACPLTRDNAIFLARQRRAFLLGFPGPDFTGTATTVAARVQVAGPSSAEVGESCHLGRPGTQDIYEAGGEEGLRAMGLLAWEEEGGEERELVEMANRILFPDRAERGKGS